ncbi:polyketide cyclase [Tolypothrix campylonemoides VB511288]|nr:polyketide cyclase [Tolypothrix campylonemoides VB511288]
MTRLIEILISLAIVAALFLAIALVLPASRQLEHSVETNRKLTIVFDTLNSLRRFDDWHPLVLRDPNVKIQLSGPASGKGATLTYESDVQGVGDGSWTIVESVPNERVKYAIEDIQRGSDKTSEFVLSRTGKNNRNVKITQRYSVDYGWNLLGRYSGLYVSSNVGDDMKIGLSRLSNMLAGVPNFDYSELSQGDPSKAPRVGERPAEVLLTVAAAVERTNERVQGQMKSNMEWIRKVMAANGLEAAGPVRIITNEFGSDTYSFVVAQPVTKPGTDLSADGAIKLEGPVEIVRNDASRIASVPFTGHMANLPRVRDAVRAWALTHGYETTDRPYENWNNGIDAGFTEEGQFDVVWAVK